MKRLNFRIMEPFYFVCVNIQNFTSVMTRTLVFSYVGIGKFVQILKHQSALDHIWCMGRIGHKRGTTVRAYWESGLETKQRVVDKLEHEMLHPCVPFGK